MRKQWSAAVLVVVLLTGTVSAQDRVSEPLGWTGVVTAIVGLNMLLPYGETYRLLGDSYCVSNDYHDVDYGECQRPAPIKIGMIMMGSGVAMALIGFSHKNVKVSPMLGKDVKGVQGHIVWGK